MSQLVSLLQNVTRDGNDITFSGVNLNIVNGTGTTGGAVNGLGNLIVGYNEIRGADNDRSGSHTIVVGREHNYSSYGGVVVGRHNTISGIYSSVTGGLNNEASGDYSMVAGGGHGDTGKGNQAFANNSAILGGIGNFTGDPSLVNHSAGEQATVSGGWYNIASGRASSVSGGSGNEASGGSSSVSGGRENIASGFYASVTGGKLNKASGNWSMVAGGGHGEYGNEAFAHHSAILGGTGNITGDPFLLDPTIGEQSTISGGNYNTASGQLSSVSGGRDHSVSGIYDWRAGGLFQEE